MNLFVAGRRVQLIWWGWERWRVCRIWRWSGCLDVILHTSLILGPLEVRVWRRDAKASKPPEDVAKAASAEPVHRGPGRPAGKK